MNGREHSPAYAANLRGTWRVVVPIRGRLTPEVCAPLFKTQVAAVAWMQSEEGQELILLKRTSPRPARLREAPHRRHLPTG